MYTTGIWWKAPLFYIPATLLWAFLDYMYERFRIAEKISRKLKWHKSTVRKIIHITNLMLSFSIIALIYAFIRVLTGFDLFNWQLAEQLWD